MSSMQVQPVPEEREPAQVIDADSRPLAVIEQPRDTGLALFGSTDPSEIISRAVRVADALKAVIVAKNLVKNIQGKEYVEVAGWQTLGAMLRVTTVCEWTRPVDGGWEARVIVRASSGADIGAAEAQCTRSEKAWGSRDDYALRSMAQTRATSKALRSVLGFCMVLAGFKDTPAEEVPPQGFVDKPTHQKPRTDPAIKRGKDAIMAFCKEHGVSDDQRHEAMMDVVGKASLRDVKDANDLRTIYKRLRDVYGNP